MGKSKYGGTRIFIRKLELSLDLKKTNLRMAYP